MFRYGLYKRNHLLYRCVGLLYQERDLTYINPVTTGLPEAGGGR